MKTGKTLVELAQTLQDQLKTKKDYVADTRQLTLGAVPGNGGYSLEIKGHDILTVNDLAHNQIGDRLGIPKTYYDRMRTDAPGLLMGNVNHWFQNKPEKRMIRTISGKARAFLSDRYRPLDNFDLAEVVLPVIHEQGCYVESCDLTETKLYVKAVNARIEGEIKQGDIVQAGVLISNSEVGCGSVRIEPLVYRLSCKNGLVSNDYAMKKYHVGRSGADFERGDVSLFFKDETRMADDKAFWMKVRDVVSGALSEAIFKQIVDKMKEAAGIKIEGDPVAVVEIVSEHLGLSKDEGSGVLRHLIEGGDLSLWGMVNAITRTSQDLPDYDRATEFERFGGQVLYTPKLVKA